MGRPLNLFDELVDSGNLATEMAPDFLLTEIFEVTKIKVERGQVKHGRAYKTLTIGLTKPDGEMKEIALTLWSRNIGPQGRIDLRIGDRRTK